MQSNNNNVNTGPVFAIFPIHGGRGVESRLTVDGLNIGNPPGGNQPSNYVADIGNASEVTMITSGGLGELETAGVTVNIIPKQGGNTMSGLVFASGFGEGHAVEQLLRPSWRHAVSRSRIRCTTCTTSTPRSAGRSSRTSSGTT